MSADFEESFLGMLLGDVSQAMERHQLSGSQAEKRNLVRTTFAAIEGLAWIFREHIVDVAETTAGLKADEIQALAETACAVSEQGRISVQSRFIPFLAGIRLIARIAERLTPEAAIDFSGKAWPRFKNAVALRNRITHPKSRSDITLTEVDVAISLGALFWFLEVSAAAKEATNRAARDYLGQLDEVFQLLRNGDPATTALYELLVRAQAEHQP
ncbi:MAG: hypothetical protein ABIT10_01910 [Alteraurantiacibacter sp.]